MKKSSKKLLVFLLSFFMIIATVSPAFASIDTSQGGSKIISENVSEELVDYAKGQFKRHLLAVSRDSKSFGMEDKNIHEFTLGEPFSLYFYENEENNKMYYFPVVYKNNIEALLGVLDVNGEYYSMFEKGFSNELENLLKNYNSTFKIFNIDGDIKAVSDSKEVLLAKENFNPEKLKRYIDINEIKSTIKTPLKNENLLSEKDLKEAIEENVVLRYDPGAPYEYNSVNMRIVLQGDYNWCWAATCAGIINHLKGKYLSARDVVVYVKGSAIDEGGSWSDMKKAYNHWGLSPYETGTLPYWQVKNSIDSSTPIHLRLNAGGGDRHSVTLKGYEKYRDGNDIYVLIDPNKNYVVSMDMKEDRNQMYYILDGKAYFWNNSIIGF